MTRWLFAAIVLAGCTGGSDKHPTDSQTADGRADSTTGDAPGSGSGSGSDGGSGEIIAMGSAPFAINVDATTVYWSDINLSNVSSMPIAGGTATTLGTNLVMPYYLQHDASSLYWGLEADTIAKIPLAGGTPVPLQTSNNTGLIEVELDASNVFHAEDFSTPQGCSIVVVPKAGGTRVILASGGAWNHPIGMAVAGNNVFWSVADPGAILMVPVGGGTTGTLVSGVTAERLAADATNVYWFDASGAIMKVAQTGGAPVTLATSDRPFAIATDGAFVYWGTRAGQGPSGIYKVPIAGGTTTTLASGLDWVNGIAVDATHIYWTENTGAIKRAPK